jgi:hypothetical protein
MSASGSRLTSLMHKHSYAYEIENKTAQLSLSDNFFAMFRCIGGCDASDQNREGNVAFRPQQLRH